MSSTRQHGGTGLGLSLCRKLVELMGGVMGACSSKGQGSLFWFALPLREPESERGEGQQAEQGREGERAKGEQEEGEASESGAGAGGQSAGGVEDSRTLPLSGAHSSARP